MFFFINNERISGQGYVSNKLEFQKCFVFVWKNTLCCVLIGSEKLICKMYLQVDMCCILLAFAVDRKFYKTTKKHFCNFYNCNFSAVFCFCIDKTKLHSSHFCLTIVV